MQIKDKKHTGKMNNGMQQLVVMIIFCLNQKDKFLIGNHC